MSLTPPPVPPPYPFGAGSEPLPPPKLSDIRQPQYDTEILPAAGTPNELVFFQRQLGNTTQYCGVTKCGAETNVAMPGQICIPLEFDLAGFFMILDATPEDIREIEKGEFLFFHTGNRVFRCSPISCIARNPVTNIPQRIWPQDKDKFEADRVERGEYLNQIQRQEVGPSEFFVGKKLFRITSNDTFQIRLRWDNGAPVLSKDVRITMVMDGLQRTPV